MSGLPERKRRRVVSTNAPKFSISPEAGYAKLEAPDWAIVLTELQTVFGRTDSEGVDVHLGHSKLISRKHARMFYDAHKKHFFLECLGKNGISINGVLVLPVHAPVMLQSGDLISIGGVEFEFLLPYKTAKYNERLRANSERAAARYHQKAAEARALKGGAGSTADDDGAAANKGSENKLKRSRARMESESDSESNQYSKKRSTGAASRLARRGVDMDGWSEERMALWQSNDLNPEPYYLKYNEPGDLDAHGPWTQREESLFWARFKEVGVDGWWGTFSRAIPGRTGEQCFEFYCRQVEQGNIVDDRFDILDGKAVFARTESSRKPHRPQIQKLSSEERDEHKEGSKKNADGEEGARMEVEENDDANTIADDGSTIQPLENTTVEAPSKSVQGEGAEVRNEGEQMDVDEALMDIINT